jgi:predicted HAD superfamily Cof-like phosphohydrolase
MVSNFERVREFMTTFGQEVKTSPEFPSEDIQKLRVELIDEEFKELQESKSLTDIADALTDLLVVIYGAGHAYGIDLDECFKEVHRSNMSKLGEDGKPIYREDGKVLKGPNYSKPNLEAVLDEFYKEVL